MERLSVLIGAARDMPLQGLCDRVLADVADFAADMPQYDDQTLLLLRRSGAMARLNSTGVPVGMFPDASWRQETMTLSPGDLLCIYTDGLTEAVNLEEEEFGMERLSALIGAGRDSPLKGLCERVLADVADFAADMPQYDDQTLLLLRRKEVES